MSENEADVAHEASELFQKLIVSTGVTLLRGLTAEQQEYVITKAHDEFRFWRVKDALKNL